jgi:polyhydroxyalkanoate synthesis regulator phasin
LIVIVIDKEIIDEHTKQIEALMNRAPMPEVSGDGPDMSQLMNIFASKTPPDNTIKRIEELENQIKNLGNPGPAGLDGDSMSKLNDLLRRVQSLETRADKSDRRMDLADDMLADHERRIKALESKDVPMPEITSSSGEVDMTALKNFIALEVSKVRNEVNTLESKVKVDLDQLRIELRGYTDQQTDTVSQKLTLKMNEAFEKLSYEQDRLRAEFETFKSKDFRDLEARVTALEKKFLRLQEAFNNLKIPESAGGGVS